MSWTHQLSLKTLTIIMITTNKHWQTINWGLLPIILTLHFNRLLHKLDCTCLQSIYIFLKHIFVRILHYKLEHEVSLKAYECEAYITMDMNECCLSAFIHFMSLFFVLLYSCISDICVIINNNIIIKAIMIIINITHSNCISNNKILFMYALWRGWG